MPIFNFQLRPLRDIEPWTTPSQPGRLSLSWFGLTDGDYWIDLGPARIFQYTPDALAIFAREYRVAQRAAGDCVDYQVVRLHEDLLEMLPDVLAELPPEAHAWIRDCPSKRAWRKSLNWVHERDEDRCDDVLLDLYEQAAGWFRLRHLDTLYLQQGPDLRIWRHEGRIHFLWDNDSLLLDGVPRWTAGSGVYSVPVAEFLREVAGFHDALIEAMAERVRIVVNENPFPGVELDPAKLKDEQDRRTAELDAALRTPASAVDWSAVFEANRLLRRS